MKIGNNIRNNRLKLKLTQEKLAERLGVSVQAVSSWECDTYQPDLDKLEQLAGIFGILPGELLKVSPGDITQSLHDRIFSEERMKTFVRSAAAAKGLEQTLLALPVMSEMHKGQVRKGTDAVPYIYHPLMMACHALALGICEDDIIATILLHDVVEDSDITIDELRFNDRIKEAVSLLTFSVGDSETKEQAKIRYYEAISENRIASVVKVIDRCNNVSCMATGFTRERMSAYIVETENYIIPLLNTVKNNYPALINAAFLIKYQILGVTESIKRLL